MKISQLIYLGAIALLLLVSCNNKIIKDRYYGEYQSISESEWDINVRLFPNGGAEVKLENWLPGGYEKRNIKSFKGNWIVDNNKILIKYDSVVDIFTYTDNLSLDEIGFDGGAPGLIQNSPINVKSSIHGIKLWKKPFDFIKNIQ